MVFVVSILTLAILTPTQLTPLNGSTVSSNTITWQAVEGAKDYRIIVDNSSPPTSPYTKDYYPTNPSYSPQLSPGTYYWKVEARDNDNQWSNWSSIWSFTLSTSQPSPSPSPSVSPSPSPSVSSSPSPSPSPTSSFTVSTVPPVIDSTDSFWATVTISGLQASSQYYLKGAFSRDNSTNYFGKTQVGGDWVKNSQTYSSQLPITTDSSGSWSGSIAVMPDVEDSGFSGTGTYLFKVARYLSTGSGLTWSNESSITINQQSQGATQSEESLAETPSPSPSPISSTAPSEETTDEITDQKSPKAVNTKIRLPDLSSNSAKIAGIATESATPAAIARIRNTGRVNFPLVAGGVLIGVSFGSMLILKKIGKI